MSHPCEVSILTRFSPSNPRVPEFLLVSALHRHRKNPCPCGYLQDTHKAFSLPHGICAVFAKLAGLDDGEPSATILAGVDAARAVQAKRFAPLGKPHFLVNGDMGPAKVQRFCQVDEEGKSLMRAAVRQMDLSARSYHPVLKLARTIANLAEALQYRPRELVYTHSKIPGTTDERDRY